MQLVRPTNQEGIALLFALQVSLSPLQVQAVILSFRATRLNCKRRSVWYCSVECQRHDYNARHKRECAKFARPPLTRSFFTEPLGACRYARHPVFGHSSRDGVGIWVSHDGRFGWR